ncbi:MAG TPA: GNAT family N-acetyltransferase [Polyangiaceae bacterium]
MSDVSLRPVAARESELIFSFLTIAARMAESSEPIQKALVDPQLVKYWQGWQREGDLGVVAVRSTDAWPIACAWVRRLPSTDSSYVAEGVLELAIGTIAAERGHGHGSRVLGKLIELCAPISLGISLTVRADNPAVRLYERFGFQKTAELTNRVGSRSVAMLLRFGA